MRLTPISHAVGVGPCRQLTYAHITAPLAEWLALAQHYQTHAVPQRYNAGVVFASIAVSVLGCYTTLLLLGRRTSKGGVRDFLLLVMSASTMSGVGIW